MDDRTAVTDLIFVIEATSPMALPVHRSSEAKLRFRQAAVGGSTSSLQASSLLLATHTYSYIVDGHFHALRTICLELSAAREVASTLFQLGNSSGEWRSPEWADDLSGDKKLGPFHVASQGRRRVPFRTYASRMSTKEDGGPEIICACQRGFGRDLPTTSLIRHKVSSVTLAPC